MASINFPNSPLDGDTFTYSGKTFEWSTANGIWVRRPNGPIPIIATLDTPVLSGVSTINELETTTITISNYDPLATYYISVSGGTFVRTGDSISWTLPAADNADITHSIYIYAALPGAGISLTAQHDILVSDVVINLLADTSIIIGVFGTDSSSIDWEF